MTPLPTLLRDACFAGALLSLAGFAAGGTEWGTSLAAGAVGGVVNLGGLVLTVRGGPAWMLGRLALHNAAALVVLYALLTRFEPLPAMLGLLAPLAAITARTFLLRAPRRDEVTGVHP